MKTLLIIFILLVAISIGLQVYLLWKKRQVCQASAEQSGEYDGMDTPTMFKELLKKLNSTYEIDPSVEDKNFFAATFSYQGEHFWVNIHKKSVWVRIIDCQWFNCSLDNLEEMACMQKAINIANANIMGCQALYNIDTEEHMMNVYSKCEFALFTGAPSPETYLTSYLSGFFDLKRRVGMEFEKEKSKVGLED